MRKTGIYNIKITTLTDCYPQRHLIKGTTKQGAKVFAALIHIDTPLEKVKRMVADCEIEYFPYDETTGRFLA